MPIVSILLRLLHLSNRRFIVKPIVESMT